MLDVIEDWAVEFKGWNICRIDGKTTPLDRRAEMDRFNQGGDDPEAPRLFLLSTRSGGLGINLVAADTVIFYDQDWASLDCMLWYRRADSSFIESSNGSPSPRSSSSYRAN